jgi:hypothetical protein
MYKAGAQKTHVNSFMAAGLSSPPSFLLSNAAAAPLCPEYNCVCSLARGSSRDNWDNAVASPALFI